MTNKVMKMVILRGLPASGKTTYAEQLMKSMGNAVRINKDLLRTMLHFDRWTGLNESKTRSAARDMARMFLKSDVNVIVDETNLSKTTLQGWIDLAEEVGAKIEVKDMDITLEECIARDQKREKGVGRSVIVGMALRGGIYPKPTAGVVLCDIDGTLADISHRLHFVRSPEGEKKDWKSFFEAMDQDTPRDEVVDMVLKHEAEGRKVFIVSARPDNYRQVTEAWLERIFKGYRPYEAVLMRHAGDKRPDTQVKLDILRAHFPDYSWIHEIIDDRPSVIRMWREQGLRVVDVGKGVEF